MSLIALNISCLVNVNSGSEATCASHDFGCHIAEHRERCVHLCPPPLNSVSHLSSANTWCPLTATCECFPPLQHLDLRRTTTQVLYCPQAPMAKLENPSSQHARYDRKAECIPRFVDHRKRAAKLDNPSSKHKGHESKAECAPRCVEHRKQHGSSLSRVLKNKTARGSDQTRRDNKYKCSLPQELWGSGQQKPTRHQSSTTKHAVLKLAIALQFVVLFGTCMQVGTISACVRLLRMHPESSGIGQQSPLQQLH